jgi:hypothetical protein
MTMHPRIVIPTACHAHRNRISVVLRAIRRYYSNDSRWLNAVTNTRKLTRDSATIAPQLSSPIAETDVRTVHSQANQDGQDEMEEAFKTPRLTLTPKAIRAHLDENVVGQEKLKKTISVAVFNHYVKVESNLYVFYSSLLTRQPTNFGIGSSV